MVSDVRRTRFFVILLSLFAPLTLPTFYDTIELHSPSIEVSIAGKLSDEHPQWLHQQPRQRHLTQQGAAIHVRPSSVIVSGILNRGCLPYTESLVGAR